MSTAILRTGHLRGLGLTRTVGYNSGMQTGVMKPSKALYLDDENANIIDSNNQILQKQLDQYSPVPVSITANVAPPPGPDGIMQPLQPVQLTPAPASTSFPVYQPTYQPADIIGSYQPIDLPQQTYVNYVNPVQPGVAPTVASYTPVDTSGGIFGTGNLGPAILTPVPTQGVLTPATPQALLAPAPQPSVNSGGTFTLFGYTAPKTTWVVIGVVAAFALSSLLDSGPTTRRR